MPIGKVWIYRLLFLCVCTVTDFSAKDKLAASNFARRFFGFQGRERPLMVNFGPEAPPPQT